MSTRPSGLACSEAILAISLEPASPTEPVTPVAALMSALSRSPTARGSSAIPPASRSTKASSRLSGSTSGESLDSSSITVSLICR